MGLMQMAQQGRAWLRETSWSYLLGVSYFLMALTAIAAVGADRGGIRIRVANLFLAGAFSLVAAKLLVDGYGGLARYREATREDAPWFARLSALMPRLLVAQARMDRAHLGAFGAWIRRLPPEPLAPGRQFGLQKRSSYSTLIVLGLISTFVDLPMSALIASVMSKDPAVQLRIHLLMGALAIYSLIWLLGDRRLMQRSAHVLDDSALHLTIAGRLRAHIPLADIVRAEAVNDSVPDWCKRQVVPLSAALCVRPSPFDRPNLALFLNPGTSAELIQWQLQRPAPRILLLHVDEPGQLLAALFPVPPKD